MTVLNRPWHLMAICFASLLILVISGAAPLRAGVTDPFVPVHVSNPDNQLAVLVTAAKPGKINCAPHGDGFSEDAVPGLPPAPRGRVTPPAWNDQLDLPQAQILPYGARAPPSCA